MHKEAQQGFVLALSLILLLFIGVVVVSSVQRTSTETRVSQTEAHIASIQAAAEAGVLRIQAETANSTSDTEISKACENFTDHLSSVLEDANEFMRNPDIWWRFDGLEKNCTDVTKIENKIRGRVEAWQGNKDPENHPIARTFLGFVLVFGPQDQGEETDPNDVSNSNDETPSVGDLLDETFGDRLVTTPGDVNVRGNAKIDGNVAVGGSAFTGGSRSDITGKVTEYTGAADPLGLKSFIENTELNEAFFGVPVETVFFGRKYSATRLQNLKTSNSQTLNYTGNTLLYVEGDLDFSNRTTVNIAEGGSLIIIVKGSIKIGNFFETNPKQAASESGLPTFALMTPSSSKVSMGRIEEAHGMIYAPDAEVDIGAQGAEFHGQIFAGSANLRAQGSTIQGGKAFDRDKLNEDTPNEDDPNAGGNSSPNFGPNKEIEMDFDFQ